MMFRANWWHRLRLWFWRKTHPKQAAAARDRLAAYITGLGGIQGVLAAHDGDLKSYDDWRLEQWRKVREDRPPEADGE